MSMYEKVGPKFFSELLQKGDDPTYMLTAKKEKKTMKIDIRVTPVLYQRLRLLSLENGRSMSNYLQMMIAREWHFRAHAKAMSGAFLKVDEAEQQMVELANQVDPIDRTLMS